MTKKGNDGRFENDNKSGNDKRFENYKRLGNEKKFNGHKKFRNDVKAGSFFRRFPSAVGREGLYSSPEALAAAPCSRAGQMDS
jgi:hypothetical protein